MNALARRNFLGLLGGAALAAPALVPAAARARAPASPYPAAVAAAYAAARGINEGKNADYIPVLAAVDPSLFGIALTTISGEDSSAGDLAAPFSIQSISKVFTCALVMQEAGPDAILNSVGVDATGDVFNSITAIERKRGRDMNPFVNPGAIATTGNVKGSAEEKWAKILAIHSEFAGRPLAVDEEVYRSETDTNQRNRAISMLMNAYERFPGDPAVAVDLYTRQCSIAVTARDLGVMAATLAAGGRNPKTGRQVIDRNHVPSLLAIMATAGLYDDSGQWLFKCGLPAKSGVGGGIIAVAPGRYGIGTFAPPLDEAGNSVRGQRAIIDIVRTTNSNPFAQFG